MNQIRMESDGPLPEPKRRKTRKGTRSCWECKRRKVRCTYGSPTDSICIGCSRRCTECISQEFPSHRHTTAAAASSRLVGDRIGRVEAMVKELVKLRSSNESSDTRDTVPTSPITEPLQIAGISTPTSRNTPLFYASPCGPQTEGRPAENAYKSQDSVIPDRPNSVVPTRVSPAGSEDLEAISTALLSAYPAPADIKIILENCGVLSIYYAKVWFKRYRDIQRDGLEVCMKELRVQYTRRAHPTLVAKQMLQLALVLQQTGTGDQKELKALSEPVQSLEKRLADTAIRFATENDKLIGNIEGLSCVILQAMYEGNQGNLRRGWLTVRHAIGMAQLMNIQRPNHPPVEQLDPAHPSDTEIIWFRLLYTDRFLSLILGLPQASLDTSMESKAALREDTGLGQLERLESRVLQRNERDPSSSGFSATIEIDGELQRAAGIMPTKWWLAPNLSAAEGNEMQLFWETSRLLTQITHYNLVNQLHLPHMLQSSPGLDRHRLEYSRAACVSASREILTRYVMFRSFNRIPHCCRAVDFVALWASLTLVFAYLDGHLSKRQGGNVLVHQRFSDRAMMEQVLENMEQVASLNEDFMSSKSADLLHRLLEIEDDAARGALFTIEKGPAAPGNSRALQIMIPYAGLITIAQHGEITRTEGTQLPQHSLSSAAISKSRISKYSKPLNSYSESSLGSQVEGDIVNGDVCAISPHKICLSEPLQSELTEPGPANTGQPVQMSSETFGNTLPPQVLYPGVTADAEQWAFQGVDMAFFGNLMRDSDIPDETHNLWHWPGISGTDSM